MYDFPKASRLNFVTMNKIGTLVAFTTYDDDGKGMGIFLCDLLNRRPEKIYNNEAYDLMFDISQNPIEYNGGFPVNLCTKLSAY